VFRAREKAGTLRNTLLLVRTAINVVLGLELNSAGCNLKFQQRRPRR